MRKLAFLFVCVVFSSWGQTELRHIAGTVVDSEGKPIEKATIDHNNSKSPETGPDGKFEIDTLARAVVIRKAGFRSERFLTQDVSTLRITLRAADRPRLPSCSRETDYVGMEGFGSNFFFPRIPGIKYSNPVRDIDYAGRSYYVDKGPGSEGISHGSGPMWSFGTPLERDVQEAVEYQEIVYPFQGRGGILPIIDARGRSPDGTRWRSLGKFGETAEYHGVDDATAQILDKVLDGVCLK